MPSILVRRTFLAVILLQGRPLSAQFQAVPEPNEREQAADFRLQLPHDPRQQAQLNLGLQAIRDGHTATGLEILQELLDQQPDFFRFEGLKIASTLRADIDAALLKYRDEYQRLLGEEAQQVLDDALESQSADDLVQVVRRFEQTNAGAAALQVLAELKLAGGEPGLAARLYDRLAQHPHAAPRAGEVLVRSAAAWYLAGARGTAISRLKQDPPAVAAYLKQQRMAPLKEGEEGEWLADFLGTQVLADETRDIQNWRTPYGGIDHEANASFAPPIFPGDWRRPVIDEYDQSARDALGPARQMEAGIRSRKDLVAMPAAVPLIVDGTVIVAGYGNLKAFDLETGEWRWPAVVVDRTFEFLFHQSYSPYAAPGEASQDVEKLFFHQRGWRDRTATSLSADSRQVYALTDCTLAGTVAGPLALQNPVRSPVLPDRSNLLRAYDLKTGMLQWTAGASAPATPEAGQPFPDFNSTLGQTFFYSAPLPVDGQLYVVGEERRQTQLFNIDPATGEVVWSLGLLNPNPNDDIVLDEERRLSGLMPAYSSGLLVCPTGDGVLTAVDVVQRRVVWTHQYAWSNLRRQPGRFPIMAQHPRGLTASQTAERFLLDDRWFDHRLILCGSRVVFTPPDADGIICLDLLDGTPAWPAEAGTPRGVYIAAVHEDRVIVVDHHDVYALHLENGLPAWKHPLPIPVPSGRGVVMGDKLLQPVATGEIVVIDLKNGQLLGSSALPGSLVAGNLVSARGHLITQTGTEVIAFRSRTETEREIARQLAADPDYAEALTARGKLRLFGGDVQGGITDLRRSLSIREDSAAKQLLRTTLLEGLRSDYAEYSRYADELEELIESPEDRAEFLRIQALGLEDSNPSAALERYLALLGSRFALKGVRNEDNHWSIRNDCWIRARISEIFASADPTERDHLLAEFGAWFSQLLDEAPPLAARQLRSLPAGWIGEAVTVRSLRHVLDSPMAPLEQSLTLHRFEEHPSSAIRGLATAGLIETAISRGDAESAHAWFSRLKQLPQQTPLEDGESIGDLVARFEDRDDLKQLLEQLPNWPRSFEMTKEVTGILSSSPWYPVPVFGRRSTELDGWSFHIEAPSHQAWPLDASGRLGGPINLNLRPQRANVAQSLIRYVSTLGPLACFVLYDRLVLVDLSEKESGVSQVRFLFPGGEGLLTQNGRSITPPRAVAGMRVPVSPPLGTSVPGNVSTLTPARLCYGSGSELVAIDPANGEELWRRKNVPAGSEILADEQYVVVRPPESATLSLFRAEDGEGLGTRDLPQGVVEGGWRKADWGRLMPCEEIEQGRFVFGLVDPVDGRAVWEHEGPVGTVWAPVDRRHVAFLDPSGRFVVRNGRTGEEVFAFDLPADPDVKSMRILDFSEQWVVLTSPLAPDPTPNDAGTAQAGLEISFTASGPAFAIDRATGKQQWRRVLENLSIPLDVPTRWPILLFSTVPAPGPATPFGGTLRQEVEVVAVNRFTGEEVGRERAFDEVTDRWQGETQPGYKIQFRRGHRHIVLIPTGQPPAKIPPPPAQSEPPK